MKKFIIAVSVIVLLVFTADSLYYRLGWYLTFNSDPVAYRSR